MQLELSGDAVAVAQNCKICFSVYRTFRYPYFGSHFADMDRYLTYNSLNKTEVKLVVSLLHFCASAWPVLITFD